MPLELPYAIEVYVTLQADYNRRWLPEVALGGVLAVAALGLAFGGMTVLVGRFVAGYLAAAWCFVGAAHELDLMADLNFMAPVYGWVWIAQGLLLAWLGLIKGYIGAAPAVPWVRPLGVAIAAFGLLLYPALLLALGQDWHSLPVVGTAPHPTAVFTAGVLLAVCRRPPLVLFVVPLAWAGVAGFSAYLLRYPADFTVAAAIVLACVLAVRARYP